MNGQSRDQASDPVMGRGEPAFSVTASSLHQRYMSFKSRETVEVGDQKATQKYHRQDRSFWQ